MNPEAGRKTKKEMKMKTWMLIGLILFWFGSGHAQHYKWTDENGVTHWSDTPPPQMDSVETETEINSAPTADKQSKTNPQPIDTPKNQKNTIGKSSFSGRSLKNIVPLDPEIAARICMLKSGDQEEQLIGLFGQPDGRKVLKDNSLLLNWYSTSWGAHTLFKTNGSIASAGAMAKNRPSDVHNFTNGPPGKRGAATLAEVESKWGKSILVKASFSRIQGDQCVKDHVFFLDDRNELITLRFVNNILEF